MELVKEKWTKGDIKDFQEYFKTLGNPDREEWTKNIINTSLPCLAIKSADIKKVSSTISKGNYLSFLDLMLWDYYENTAVNGSLISKIKDFDTMKKYLDIYGPKADNWATCDGLKFDIKGREDKFLSLSLEYVKSDKAFVRRIGIRILFYLIDNPIYVDRVFEILDMFSNEKEYYVNMVNAWLLCDLFIKYRDKTLKYLNKNKLNDFTMNKAISKCRDSFRVTASDKELLLKYKRNVK